MPSATIDRFTIEYPKQCPMCHNRVPMMPGRIAAYSPRYNIIYVSLMCPNPDCSSMLFCLYEPEKDSGNAILRQVIPNFPTPDEIPEIVQCISPEFARIYQQAKHAKEIGLNEICGPGYRKAFEFLIKDYAKSKVVGDTDEEVSKKKKKIEQTFAGTVVKDFIEYKRVQSAAKRALWIGNDETHYLRTWKDKDIEDLINLIKLTIRWIEIEHLSDGYDEEMPE